jgi:hypothetical protein
MTDDAADISDIADPRLIPQVCSPSTLPGTDMRSSSSRG